jgi:phosphoribosylformimino-5-aminoimidazole carboxamide ribotide isomerase
VTIIMGGERTLKLFPAIDIRGGRVVRLIQGDFARLTQYNSSPAAMAQHFREQGAQYLHVVDLDGAKDGTMANTSIIEEILKVKGLFVQLGGGIRDRAAMEAYFNLGVHRIILGTVAAENFSFLEECLAAYGDRVAVAVDARKGKVAVRGWQQDSNLDAFDFCKRLEQAGVSTIIYTDIARDGLLQGVDLELYRQLNALVRCDIIASGGVSTKEEVQALAQMNLYGAIVGKALYEGTLDLKELLCI